MSKEYSFTVIIEPDDDQYHGFVPALPGCHTFGPSVEAVRENLTEAIQLHVESMIAHEEDVPSDDSALYTRVSVALAA
jgi:predicted RNase H-like HicB family nuclease